MAAITGELQLSKEMQDAILAALQADADKVIKEQAKAKTNKFKLLGSLAFLGLALLTGYASPEMGLAVGAVGFYITNAIARNMLKSAGSTLAANIDAGTAAVIEIYNGSVPADADASEANTLLASLTCSATCFSGDSDANPGGRITFDVITSDSSADATGTATHFRIKTQTGGTVCCQGTVGTATSDLIVNTTAFTSGSTVSITSGTITLPEGP